MDIFAFGCRAIDIEHSCDVIKSEKSTHPPEFLDCINNIVNSSKDLNFACSINSPSNNYQIDNGFDSAWEDEMKKNGWQIVPTNLNHLKDIPDIKPDTILVKNGIKIVVEIEKTNKKTIWFDFIKLLLLMGQREANYGLLLVPRNYAHAHGVWNLFEEARKYKGYLVKYAGVDGSLFSKIAIIGYTQEAVISDDMSKPVDNTMRLEKINGRTIKHIKSKAKIYYSQVP